MSNQYILLVEPWGYTFSPTQISVIGIYFVFIWLDDQCGVGFATFRYTLVMIVSLLRHILVKRNFGELFSYRSRHPEVFFKKVFWKYAANLQENAHVELRLHISLYWITLRDGCSPVNLLHIFRTPFSKNTSRRLLLFHILI